MKRRLLLALAALLVLTLLTGAVAEFELGDEARVVNCNEYVTLREEASTSASALARVSLGTELVCLSDDGGKFVHVWTDGWQGYVLRRYLENVTTYGTAVELTDAQRADMNLFLSNFTETNLSAYCDGAIMKSLELSLTLLRKMPGARTAA